MSGEGYKIIDFLCNVLPNFMIISNSILRYKIEQVRLSTYDYSIVNTNLGPVKGVKRFTVWGDTYYSYERIPFAQPPIGELRFRAPVPAAPWNDVLDCTSSANKPMQAHIFFKKHTGSEDCLYLSVFVKDSKTSTSLPVMVWIYGGAFQVGETSRDMYSPDFFMSKDIILVSIAYRLGAFGFLSLNDAALNVPGNAGLKDQIMGLRWVKENIAAFGGDPNNITLFGESAGAASTHLLILSEQSKGLVNKSIAMSGSALCPWALPPPNDWAYSLAQKLGFKEENVDEKVFKFLQSQNGGDIVMATPAVLTKQNKHNRVLVAFGPVIEPYVTEQCIISEQPYELMKKTWSNSIPFMIGGNSFEGLLFYPEITRRPATLDEIGDGQCLLPVDIKNECDAETRERYGLQLKKAYFGDEPCNTKNKFNFLDLNSYREFWHPIYRTGLSRLQYANAPTYLYRFDYDSEVGNSIRILACGPDVRGVCHADDICYIFYSILSHRSPAGTPEYEVQKTMIDIWTSFAAKSDPNCDCISGVNFAPLDKESEILKCLNISKQSTYIDLPELEKMKVWNSFYPKNKL